MALVMNKCAYSQSVIALVMLQCKEKSCNDIFLNPYEGFLWVFYTYYKWIIDEYLKLVLFSNTKHQWTVGARRPTDIPECNASPLYELWWRENPCVSEKGSWGTWEGWDGTASCPKRWVSTHLSGDEAQGSTGWGHESWRGWSRHTGLCRPWTVMRSPEEAWKVCHKSTMNCS